MIHFLTGPRFAVPFATRYLFCNRFDMRYAPLLSGHASTSIQPSHQIPVPHDEFNYKLFMRKEVEDIYENIRKTLSKVDLRAQSISPLASYYFDGEGKCRRPLVVLCWAKAINFQLNQTSPKVIENQNKVAQIAELIHGTSLYHDDVIDNAIKRREKLTVNSIWGQKKSISAGDFIWGRAVETISQIQNKEVCTLLTRMIKGIVIGEMMQLDTVANEEERLAHYIDKTFKKTASVFAYSCQAVSVLAGADATLQTIAFEYGRQLGIAYQLVDDIIDFSVIASTHYKAVDLNQGLANIPVLFAAQQFSELNPLISRRFKNPGDVETAYSLVLKSNGIQRTKELAIQYYDDAMNQIAQLQQSPYQEILAAIAHQLSNEIK